MGLTKENRKEYKKENLSLCVCVTTHETTGAAGHEGGRGPAPADLLRRRPAALRRAAPGEKAGGRRGGGRGGGRGE